MSSFGSGVVELDGEAVRAAAERVRAALQSQTDLASHLERGARIAFRLLDPQEHPLTVEESDWYLAELKRQTPLFDVFCVKRTADGELLHSTPLHVSATRQAAEQFRDAHLALWVEAGMAEVETDGARWAIEIREARE